MKKLLLTAALILSTNCFAGYTANAEITDVVINSEGEAIIGFTNQPTGTCNHWGRYVKFNASTEGGKLMYTTLLSAKVTKQKINFWYTDALSPDNTDQSNGCDNSKMAIMTGLVLP